MYSTCSSSLLVDGAPHGADEEALLDPHHLADALHVGRESLPYVQVLYPVHVRPRNSGVDGDDLQFVNVEMWSNILNSGSLFIC